MLPPRFLSALVRRPLVSAVAIYSLSLAPVLAQAAPPPERVSYNRHIRPILSANCFQCHGFDKKHRKAGRRLDTREGAVAKSKKGVQAVVPGDPQASELLARIVHHDAKRLMPPPASKKSPLTPEQVELVRRWIEQGAEYERHWAFLPPVRPRLPDTPAARWARSPIDRFVAAEHRARGLTPNPPADRRTLIRRVTLDLTGLLPTPAEVEAFVADQSSNAYAKVVDRLLASPHFGERMAVDWMDAARYGDTSAYHADGPRQMWKWRDGVTRSFNRNQPYDQFTIEQLAGDLIPNASIEQKVASGFNRNHCTSDEGGAFPEELRVHYVVDRVRTTSMVFMGMSLECCQCHDHKYDPFTQEEFYKFYGFFNQTQDGGMQTRGGNAKPYVGVLSMEQRQQLPEAKQKLAVLEASLKKQTLIAKRKFPGWLARRSYEVGLWESQAAGLAFREEFEAKGAGTYKARGKVRWQPGHAGTAVRVDERNFLDLGKPPAADLEGDRAFSFGAWVFPETGNGAPIAKMNDDNAHRGYDIMLGRGRVSVHLIHRWNQSAIKITTKAGIKNKRWTHIFVTYDGSQRARGMKIYLNGKLAPVTVDNDNLKGTTRSKVPLYVGRRSRGTQYRGRVDDIRFYDQELSAVGVQQLMGATGIDELLRVSDLQRTKAERDQLEQYYRSQVDPDWVAADRARSRQVAAIAKLEKPETTVMVMSTMAKPRATRRLDRGEYSRPVGPKLQPDVPASLPPMGDRPRNRLGLAQWLTAAENPLLARVTVNRFWHMLFGRGIVKTVEDLGSQGDFPTHPELLDWLAVDFVQKGWDVKRTIRQMVMSEAYRQSSQDAPEDYRRDPENTWLTRGPRFRLAAEFVRDVALQVSGLLVPTVGGPGVKPYQPPGLWNEVSLNRGLRFRQDRGEKLYRRSLYTYWRRSAPPPSMRIFDAPTRERCVMRRGRTNTPLQALVTLNDPQFLEAARFLAERMLRAGKTTSARVGFAYRQAMSRAPKAWEIEVLQGVLKDTMQKYQADPAAAKELLAAGDGKRDETIDAAEHASWMVVASMILNTDEALTKR